MTDFKFEARLKRVAPARQPVSGHLSGGGRFEPPPEGVAFQGAHLEDIDFSRLKIDLFSARGCTFERCNFSGAVIAGSLGLPPRSVYRDCRFDRADLRNAEPGRARFERCTFDGARLDGWRSWHGEFVDCHFAGRLHDVEFRGVPPKVPIPPILRERARERMAGQPGTNEFRGNDFREAELDGVEFIGGIDLDAQLWPEDPELIRLDVRPATIGLVETFVRKLPTEEQARPLDLLEWIRGRYTGQNELLMKRATGSSLGTYLDLLDRATRRPD